MISIKKMTICFSSSEEKDSWVLLIIQAKADFTKRRQSFRSASSLISEKEAFSVPSEINVALLNYPNDENLGTRAPRWVKRQDATMCMRCSLNFDLGRRHHHCRACGRVSSFLFLHLLLSKSCTLSYILCALESTTI